MATYFARKAGNMNAADVWATTPSGTASNLFPTFTNADVLMANSFAITVNVSTTVAEVRNDTTGGATLGGTFSLSNDVTLTANMIQGQVTGSTAIVTYAGSFPNSASIVGNASSVNTSGNANVIQFTGSGTLNFTGNVTGDAAGAGTTNGTINVSGGGTLNFTGNATGGSSSLGPGINVPSSTATVNVTGNCFGGTGSAPGVRNRSATGTININGIAAGSPVTGSGPGALNDSTGAIFLKRAMGNAYGPGSSGLGSGVGASNASTGFIQVEEIEFGTNGQSPTSGAGIRLKKLGSNVAVFNYCDTAGAKTLIDATANAAMPAATDVRNGVSYASGALTGSCAVPAAGSVALGVPVDATTGTAVLSVANVQSALTAQGLTTARAGALDNLDATVSSRLAPSGTLATVTTLTNAPDVPTEAEIATAVWGAATKEITGGTVTNLTNAPASVTPADIWDYNARTLTSASGPTAIEIRQEIDSNSTQLSAIKSKTDALPSDPADQSLLEAAIAGVTAPSAATVASAVRTELTAELAKVSALNTDRLANCATTAIVGNLIAQAQS